MAQRDVKVQTFIYKLQGDTQETDEICTTVTVLFFCRDFLVMLLKIVLFHGILEAMV